jgi:hypothetical protein
VDNPVRKVAGAEPSWASAHFDQKITSLNTALKNNNLQRALRGLTTPWRVKIP